MGQEEAITEDVMEEGNIPTKDLSGLSVRMWLESSINIKRSPKYFQEQCLINILNSLPAIFRFPGINVLCTSDMMCLKDWSRYH